MTVHVLGIRHHSPACARVAAWLLERVRPATVLIEGPSDFDGRLKELGGLDHQLPVALFHYRTGAARRLSYTPFCETSPEWVALRWALANGVEVRFMDLPSWADAFHVGENRTADRVDRYGAAMRALCERLDMDGVDAVWDHLFEQPEAPEVLHERLDRYFRAIRRPGERAGPRDEAREAFMARCLAWAAARGDVVAVCGGYHQVALEAAWPDLPPTWPDPPPRGEGSAGTYVVPWSFRRLDSFSGYAAGMPSPGWYQALWEEGPERGAEHMLARCIQALRARRQPVSAADHIAVHVQLGGLMSLRGHACPTRADVLDALCSALVKEALDVPPPWTRRGPPRAGTDPRLAVIVDTLCGQAVGRIHPATPRPPLIHDVRTRLEAHDLVPGSMAREVDLSLDDPADVERSRVLHRLRVLEVPGFTRLLGPELPTEALRAERWSLALHPSAEPALLETSSFGATLEDAARERLLERVAATRQLDALVSLLVDALFVGLDTLSSDLVEAVRAGVEAERDPGVLGRAVALLLAVWRRRSAFVPAGHEVVGDVLGLLHERCVAVLDAHAGGPSRDHPTFGVALRDLLRFGPLDAHDVSLALAVLERRARDRAAPVDLRGAALGILHDRDTDRSEQAVHDARAVPVDALGDWLSGLFAVTRETLGRSPALLDAVHERVAALDASGFLAALPALRLAFSWFPPREREALGRALLERLGRGGEAAALASRDVAVETAGVALEQRTEAVLARYGLLA